jgi:hypothetical protein
MGTRRLAASRTSSGEKSFAVLFVLLLCVPALPLPTGGATHVFEVIAVLLALQLIAGRSQMWLPRRWRGLELAGAKRERFVRALVRLIRRLERVSRPRLVVIAAVLVGAVGIAIEVALGRAVVHGIGNLL